MVQTLVIGLVLLSFVSQPFLVMWGAYSES